LVRKGHRLGARDRSLAPVRRDLRSRLRRGQETRGERGVILMRRIVELAMLLALFAVFLMVGDACIGASENGLRPSPEVADSILEHVPLTIVFDKVIEFPAFNGRPYGWCWSINSAGQAELTISTTAIEGKFKLMRPKSIRKELRLSADQMASIRKALRDARFFQLNKEYGPVYVHGGRSTLTVVAGRLSKSVTYCSSWGWASYFKEKRAEFRKAAPAIRLWLKICEAVDSDGKVFEEQKAVADLMQSMTK
jgi:hypothetical protein